MVQPRKTRPYITERLLMGRKESNQPNKQIFKRNLSGIIAISLSNSLDPDQARHFVGPGLGLNCLQTLSAAM